MNGSRLLLFPGRAALAVLFLAVAIGGCGSNGSSASGSSPAPASSPAGISTPYLNIQRIDKAYLASLKKNVLVVTLSQMPRGADPNGLASSVYDGIKGSLVQSNFDLAVVKIPMIRTTTSSSDAVIIYARDPKGNWSRTQDPAIIEAVDRSGL